MRGAIFLLAVSIFFTGEALITPLRWAKGTQPRSGFLPSSSSINLLRDPGAQGSRRLKYEIRRKTELYGAELESWRVLSTLSVVSTFGVWAERTRFGSMISSPLVTMLTSMVLCNLGILPKSSPIYTMVLNWLVPLAIPLLLLDADIKRCITTTGSLLKAFLVGSFGSVIGTFVAFALVPMRHTVGGGKIAAALCARHIGGAVNFVAVAEILKISPELVAASMAADNVIVALYLSYLFLISVPDRNSEDISIEASPAVKEVCPIPFFRSSSSSSSSSSNATTTTTYSISTPTSPSPSANSAVSENEALSPSVQKQQMEKQQQRRKSVEGFGLLRTMAALSIGLVLCTLSQYFSAWLGMSSMLVLSSLAVLAATLFPSTMGRVSRAGGMLGVAMMQLFFSVTGGMGHIPTVVKYGPAVFLHAAVQVTVHFFASVTLGKLIGLPFREIVLASNANVGGPTTAAAMATSKRWKPLVLPALLTGIFGYAIATPIGVGMAYLLGGYKP